MIFYDLETTGLNVLKDRIIELYALKNLDGVETELFYVLNPGIPIPPETSAIHGFTDEIVKDKPLLKDVIADVYNFFKDEDLIGYNIKRFDNLVLAAEFLRCKYDFELDKRKCLDVIELWYALEPRNLAGALKRFCNEKADGLHGAKVDVQVTSKVYKSMIELFVLKDKAFDEVIKTSCPDESKLCFGKLIRNEQGEIILNFGKRHYGKTIKEIYTNDVDYLRWLVKESDVQSDIKFYIINEVRKIKQKMENKNE